MNHPREYIEFVLFEQQAPSLAVVADMQQQVSKAVQLFENTVSVLARKPKQSGDGWFHELLLETRDEEKARVTSDYAEGWRRSESIIRFLASRGFEMYSAHDVPTFISAIDLSLHVKPLAETSNQMLVQDLRSTFFLQLLKAFHQSDFCNNMDNSQSDVIAQARHALRRHCYGDPEPPRLPNGW